MQFIGVAIVITTLAPTHFSELLEQIRKIPIQLPKSEKQLIGEK